MADLLKLGQLVAGSGMTKKHISEKLGITRYTLSNKLEGKTEFTANEIKKIVDVLHLSNKERDNIFFN